MENLTHALYMAFAMATFIIAFSVSLYLVNKLNTTTKSIVYNLDGSYYDSFELSRIIEDNNEERNRSRIVGIDTIIPTLYRYYKESFAVKILDEDGNLLQYFDTTTEGDVNSAKLDSSDEPGESEVEKLAKYNKRKALLSLYDTDKSYCYMFGAPWLADINKDAKARIDMYISGGKGFINNTLVDYSKEFDGPSGKKKISLNNFKDREFNEVFTQYAYEGDTITDENDELVTLTGSKQIATKIIIIYQLLPK